MYLHLVACNECTFNAGTGLASDYIYQTNITNFNTDNLDSELDHSGNPLCYISVVVVHFHLQVSCWDANNFAESLFAAIITSAIQTWSVCSTQLACLRILIHLKGLNPYVIDPERTVKLCEGHISFATYIVVNLRECLYPHSFLYNRQIFCYPDFVDNHKRGAHPHRPVRFSYSFSSSCTLTFWGIRHGSGPMFCK